MSIYALIASLAIQIATNLFNDAIDFKKGADTEERIGPKRVTQSGTISSKNVFLMAGFAIVVALSFGIPLVIQGGTPIIAIGLVSIFLAFAYTGGPWPLAYKGLGDIFVILFFGLIAVCGVFYLHTLTLHLAAIVAGLQVGLLCTVLIVINNIRDMEQDAKVKKRTLPVRFGANFARFEVAALIFVSFLSGFYWHHLGESLAGLLPLIFMPLAIKLVRDLYVTPPSPKYNLFLAKSALLHLGFGALLSLGLILG